MQQYDIIIIGAGPAGLYLAHKLKNPNILILERNNYVGGRTRMYDFHGSKINSGAFSIRPYKDKLMLELLEEFGLSREITNIYKNYDYIPRKIDLGKMIIILKSLVTPENQHLNTKSFFLQHFDIETYQDFVNTIGRTDFELENINNTLNFYGLEDYLPHTQRIRVDWNKLWTTISEKLNIKLNTNVNNIARFDNGLKIYTDNDNYLCKNVVIACDISTVKTLLPMYEIYNNIHGQPYILIHGLFNEKGDYLLKSRVKTMTVLNSPLQNIIPKDNGHYLIAYADNGSAQTLIRAFEDKRRLENLLMKALKIDYGLENTLIDMKSYYTNPATHYYPIPVDDEFIYSAQHPEENIYVIGELISLNQGWTEGALQSVMNIIDDLK